MYMFILWMCLTTSPECEVWQSVQHIVYIYPTHSIAECEANWKESLTVPDGEGKKSRHICKPIEEAL